jgi:hypothetical protein
VETRLVDTISLFLDVECRARICMKMIVYTRNLRKWHPEKNGVQLLNLNVPIYLPG